MYILCLIIIIIIVSLLWYSIIQWSQPFNLFYLSTPINLDYISYEYTKECIAIDSINLSITYTQYYKQEIIIED